MSRRWRPSPEWTDDERKHLVDMICVRIKGIAGQIHSSHDWELDWLANLIPHLLYDDAEFLEANREAINVRVRDLQ